MRAVMWRWMAALAVFGMIVVGCGSAEPTATTDSEDDASELESTEDDVAVDTTDAPAEPENDQAGSEAEAAAEFTMRDPAAPFAVGVEHQPEAEALMPWFAPFEPGTYRTGALGTMMSFTTEEPLNTQLNGGGFFVLSDVSSRAPDDRDLAFLRVGGFSDPTAPNTPVEEQTPWPSNDFLGWLDNLTDDIVATEPVETTVGGLPAITVDLELKEGAECGFAPGNCVGLIMNSDDIKALNHGASYRIWIVEQGDEDPLSITSGIARDEDAAWFARADAVLDTIAFGEIAPNPAQWLDPGPTRMDVLAGVEVEIPLNIAELTNGRPRIVNQWTGRGFSVIPTEEPALVFFGDRPHDLDGNPLSTTDEVLALLEAEAVTLTELDAIEIDGAPTRVFDVESTNVGAIAFKFSPLDVSEQFLGWDVPEAGKLWLIEHPDRGLMSISTHAFERVDDLLPAVNEIAEAVIGSMTFVE